MATLRVLCLCVLLLSLPLCSLSRPLSLSSPSLSFKVALIHRDSPYSPIHDPSPSPSDLFRLSAQRSLSRLQHFQSVLTGKSSPSKLASEVKAGSSEYLMRVGIGTPAEPYWLIADTGSDLTWTQCLPCSNCFEQNVPIFNPKSSSTYLSLNCSSTLCQNLKNNRKCGGSSCQYDYHYGDGSATSGKLSTETFTFETPKSTLTSLKASISTNPIFSLTTTLSTDPMETSTSATFSTDRRTGAKIKGLGFGCGNSNTGGFGQNGEVGLVGLGGGPLSLISQLGSSISNKFSYCLPSRLDENMTSVLNFGKNAAIQTSDVSSTPLIQLEDSPTFFLLNLTGISVGSKRLDIPPLFFDPTQRGEPFVIDSGTTLTILGPGVYYILAVEVEKAINLPTTDPPRPFSLCYKVPDSGNITGIPNITFHFSGNADWINGPENSFIPLDDGHMICLGILGSGQGMSILGNWAQQNKLVEYDVGKGMLSFAPARSCEV
ncbi:aspartic proteinase CDR1 [Amborella trichopoda]|uniref:Peptidase A1 domain-containing protein n=1 Tax=Amborella trichopoda TaxID=13333 RepID=W1NUA6_AMBTC|nr:aspartic proteinase CDR1 [Amborella trichopoda]ERM98234.1 hypothetical protein AMTR_s00095p00156630 [Amborella trichopoda]|eukprot:XP_006832956.1 aspartic proteinase CDR1 [Amborella trichopoda]